MSRESKERYHGWIAPPKFETLAEDEEVRRQDRDKVWINSKEGKENMNLTRLGPWPEVE